MYQINGLIYIMLILIAMLQWFTSSDVINEKVCHIQTMLKKSNKVNTNQAGKNPQWE